MTESVQLQDKFFPKYLMRSVEPFSSMADPGGAFRAMPSKDPKVACLLPPPPPNKTADRCDLLQLSAILYSYQCWRFKSNACPER